MKIIDLTRTITPDMQVYPGTEQPRLKRANTIEKDGFAETLLEMYSHTGTHTDSPAHIFEGGRSLDKFDLSELCGRAVMLDVRDLPEGSVIEVERLLGIKDKLEASRFLVLRTGFEEKWGEAGYFGGFPVLSQDAAELLVKLGIGGVGVDAISVDPVEAPLEIHKILLGAGMVIVENLCNLDKLAESTKGETFELFVMPLKFENADGAPTRVMGRVGMRNA